MKEIESYVKDQNELISKIGSYISFTMVQIIVFAIFLNATSSLLGSANSLITVFSTIVLKFVYIADALITKNLAQITAYYYLVILELAMVCIGFFYCGLLGLLFLFVLIFLILAEGFYNYRIIKIVSQKYAWHFYKKLGSCEDIQSVHRLKQSLNLFFKLYVCLNLTNFFFPGNRSKIVYISNFISFFVSYIITFLYMRWLDEDNILIRKTLIVICITQTVQKLMELAITVILQFSYKAVFEIISMFFLILNNFFFILYLYLDLQTMGKNYIIALKQNFQKQRDVLEPDNSMH